MTFNLVVSTRRPVKDLDVSSLNGAKGHPLQGEDGVRDRYNYTNGSLESSCLVLVGDLLLREVTFFKNVLIRSF